MTATATPSLAGQVAMAATDRDKAFREQAVRLIESGQKLESIAIDSLLALGSATGRSRSSLVAYLSRLEARKRLVEQREARDFGQEIQAAKEQQGSTAVGLQEAQQAWEAAQQRVHTAREAHRAAAAKMNALCSERDTAGKEFSRAMRADSCEGGDPLDWRNARFD